MIVPSSSKKYTKYSPNSDIFWSLYKNWVKGQLILKGLFCILKSSKKQTKKINNYYDTLGRLVFVPLLEEFEDQKDISKLSDL